LFDGKLHRLKVFEPAKFGKANVTTVLVTNAATFTLNVDGVTRVKIKPMNLLTVVAHLKNDRK
jgi:hypothetical protein